MEVIPFECDGNVLFLIIYDQFVTNTSGHKLVYAVVDPDGEPDFPTYQIDFPGVGVPTSVFALSQKKTDGTYHLYTNVKGQIKKFIIDFTFCQVSYELIIQPDFANPIVTTSSPFIETSELELSPDGTRLAYAYQHSNNVIVIDLDANGNTVTSTPNSLPGGEPFQDLINGLEFDRDATKLFVSYQSSSTPHGIYALDLASGNIGNPIPNTADYARSQLEMGPDCYLYAGNYFASSDENRLARIDPNTESFVTSFLLPGRLPYQSSSGPYNGGEGIFTLPDLIDCTNEGCAETDPVCDNHSLRFDGINDYVQLPNSPVQGSGDFTIEAWFFNEDSDGLTGCDGNFERIISCGGDRFEIGVCGNDLAVVVNSISTSPTSAPPILNNQWYHIAATRSGNLVELYLDCVKVFETTTQDFTLDNNFRIGRWPGGGGFDEVWEGKIDELRIWDYVRTQTQLIEGKSCFFNGFEPGLVGNYRFEQGTPNGNNPTFNYLDDYSPNVNNGTLINFGLSGPQSNWTCAEVDLARCCSNLALHFDGVDDWVQLPNSPVQGSGDFTIEAWFWSLDNDGLTGCAGNFERIIGCGGDRFEIGICGFDLAVLVNGTAASLTNAPSPSITLGWHHVAATRSGDLVTIYFNGVKVFETTQNFTLDNNFRIGRWPGGGGFDEVWSGFIDEVRIWDHARTLGELTTFKNCALNGDEPGLVDYYPFDQGTPSGDNQQLTTLIDVTAQANNGTLFNFALTGEPSNWFCSGNIRDGVCPAPLTEFEKLYGDDAHNAPTRIKVFDDGIYVTGTRHLGNAQFSRVATFSKFDLSGALVWDLQLDTFSVFQDFEYIEETDEFLLVGYTDSIGLSSGPNDTRSLLSKVTDNGTVLFTRFFSQTGREFFSKIVRHPQPENAAFPFYILGSKNRPNDPTSPPSTFDTPVVFNVDVNGNVHWVNEYHVASSDDDELRVLQPMLNGNLLVAGNENANDIRGVVFEIDGQTGQVVNARRSVQQLLVFDAIEEPGGNIVLCGRRQSNTAFIARFDNTFNWLSGLRYTNEENFLELGRDDAGDLYTISRSLNLSPNRFIVNKISGNTPSLQANYSAYIFNNETDFNNGHISVSSAYNHIFYADSRKGNPSNLGDFDILVGAYDLDLTSDCKSGFTSGLETDFMVTWENHPVIRDSIPVPPFTTMTADLPVEYSCVNPCEQDSCAAAFTFFHNGCGQVTFTDQSFSTNPISWSWTFQTGTPATSTAQNPVVNFQYGNRNVCLTITSASNCTSTVCQTISIQDDTPPVAICNSTITVALNNNCLATITPADIDNGSFDNCSICLLTLSKTQFNASDACQNIPVTLTVIDCTDKQNSCQSTVTVLDNTPPVFTDCPPNINVVCDNIPAPEILFATDNCTANVTMSLFETQTTGCPYTITRQWVAIDACGNISQCVQQLFVSDNTTPNITCPPNITVFEGSSTNPNETGEAAATDNCNQNLILTYSDITVGTDPCPKTVNRTWATVDACGNEASCVQVIAVECIEEVACDTVEATCQTDVLNISTGFDHVSNGAYTSARYDAFWEVVETEANISVPRPATVISPFLLANWWFQNGSEWISYYEDYNLTENNEVPDPPHAFQRCFCLCSDADEVVFDFSILVDDIADINLFEENGAFVANLMTLDNTTSPNFNNPPTLGMLTLPLSAGNYCIRADVRNTDQVAMGFNMRGTISGGSFIKPTCCREGNVIYGVIYHDLDMEGFRDFRLNNNPPEPGLQGWIVTLCDLGNNPLFTTTTDQYGFYKFEDVPQGSYILKQTLMPSWSQTEPSSTTYNVTIGNQEVIANRNFGNFVVNAIEEKEFLRNVSLFPNPTSGNLNLVFSTVPSEDLQFRLHDLWGRTIETRTLPKGMIKHTFDMSALPPAIYFVEISDGAGHSFRSKVVKQ